MVFKTPDGQEFETRAEFRDYMMNTFFSFKNKKDEHDLLREPGSIDGQVFEIADSKNCTMLVLDYCEQVQIDKLVNCKVMIGACASSIFIRDCTDCTFYTSCKQLRIRDCKNSTFYSHCLSEIHIELSSGLSFGHLNSGYPEQQGHMMQARLDPKTNFWYDVYDHNDPDKTGVNWKILSPAQHGAPYYPRGTSEVFVETKRGKAGTAAQSSQVGESFQMDRMVADKAAAAASAPAASRVRIPVETSLMVANALARRIDVLAWLCEGQANEDSVSMEFFRGKLHSLAAVIGVEADAESQAELDIGVSPSSLEKVEAACPGTGGASTINVPVFLTKCEQIMTAYLENPANADSIEEPIGLAEEEEGDVLEELEEIEEEQEGMAPMSPSGSPKESLLPSSPYDESVEFDVDDEDETDTLVALGSRPKAADVTKPSRYASTRPKPRRPPVVVSRPPAPKPAVPLDPHSAELQAQVREQIRGTVKRTDLYHSLQVHLGFIGDSYTMNTGRGVPVRSVPRQWLGVIDLKRAFDGARVRFTDVQIYALIKMVKAFAREVREVESGELAPQAGKGPGAAKPLHRQPVVLNRKLNANWLRRYLVTLRLTRQTKPWQTWLVEKVATSREKQGEKPKMFMRALAGRPHTLSKEDINAKLEHFEIVPKAEMDAEIDLRVECWVVDTAGRRDFRFTLNQEITKYQKAHLTMPFKRLPASQQKSIRRDLSEKLRAAKQKELVEGERATAAITKDLYWKYDAACRRDDYRHSSTFGEWLAIFREKGDARLRKFKEDMAVRSKLVQERAKRRSAVASLKTVEGKLFGLAETLPLQQSIEVRKSVIALRKSAEMGGAAKGALVTMEDFDEHLHNVLNPLTKTLPQDLRDIALDPLRKSKEMEGMLADGASAPAPGPASEIFYESQGEAAKHAVLTGKENERRTTQHFEAWVAQKDAKAAQVRAEEEKALNDKTAEEKMKKKKARKAFRQWLKLRRQDKYISTVDGKLRDLPDSTRVRHDSRWNKDVEMEGYYATQEAGLL